MIIRCVGLIFLLMLTPAVDAESVHPCYSQGETDTALDKTYHYINTKFCQPAVWFDNFFVDHRASEDARAGTVVRWYNDFSTANVQRTQYKTKVKIRFHLPKVTEKLKVVLEADAEDSFISLFAHQQETQSNSLGLRYDIYAQQRASFNLKATLKPSLEGKFRYTYPFNTQTSATFSQKIYQKKKNTGEITQFDIDHALNKTFLIRWSNFAKYEDQAEYFELGTGLTLYQYLNKSSAINYKASLNWQDKPYHFINNSRLALTYRANIYKKWLFYELTPEYNWPKNWDQDREKQAKITFRLEVLFHNI